MWDRPGLLNAAASALYAVAALLALYMAAARVTALPAFALREVRIGGAPAHVTRAQVEAIVQRELRGSFFTLDLAAARAAFETLPWVRRVNVRRQWPDRLEVALEEHVPLARWAGSELVNTHGEVFEAAHDGKLPVFAGPPGSAREITIQYEYFRRSLAAIGQTPVQVQISPRRAWQLKLESGLTLELGREQVEARLARFVAVYGRTLGRLGRRLDYVDLRYANGFAVRIPELRHEKEAPARGRRGRG
ncbi:MAG: FtsQ-type POTRA domain-containing protein [Betaproteobacteria bacterium]|nr:FtsQ-type POTRA domain-containing protein [Betaproteobacteria bacterium]